MSRKKTKKWSNYGDGIQLVDVIFEVRKMDDIRLSKGKESNEYTSKHKEVVNLINRYNRESPGGTGKFDINISRARYLIQLGAGNKDFTL